MKTVIKSSDKFQHVLVLCGWFGGWWLLVELLLGDVDEEAVEAAHARVALFFTGGLARR